MEFVGIMQASWLNAKDVNSRNICAILIDTNFLLNNWTRENEDNMENSIRTIEKHVWCNDTE